MLVSGFMHTSYDSGILTSILVYPSFERKYGLYSDRPAGYAIIAVSLAASFIASFVSGFIADGLGRRFFFMVASIIHTIGGIVQIAGHTQASFFAGRIITGLSTGILSMLVPLSSLPDQSEIARPKNRGRLITIYQIFVTLGFCIAFWLGYATYPIEGELSWKIPLGIQIVPGVLLLLSIYFIPESPRWLIYQSREKEAYEILSRLRSCDVRMEFTSILQDLSFDKMAYKHRFLSLMSKGNDNNRKRTLLGIGIHAFTQLSGANAILFYFPYILQSAGVTGTYLALLGNGIGGLVNFVATLFVMIYIDKWGRRKILVSGGLGMAVCMIFLSVVSAIFDQNLIQTRLSDSIELDASAQNPKATYAIIVLLCLFIIIFALSWGPIGWLYPAEIYPQMLRANAMGVTTACSYLFSLLISLVTPVMFANIGWKTYLFFTCMCLCMSITVHLFYPETKGRSLEEIQLIFSGALVDKRADAHHPVTAAEALIQLEHIKHQQQRERLAKQDTFNLPIEWTVPPSPPASINNNSSHRGSSVQEIRSTHNNQDSIELSNVKSSSTCK
ncbi:hypothetical protein G6F37_010625 [Rhizopus arrhizus]|nr:hypothetical protein G6F38_012052 [Rhizopus arrhizus]KAG1153142.1 hypothetical protein G6F37_010625 [Rhizopus arrhizus]